MFSVMTVFGGPAWTILFFIIIFSLVVCWRSRTFSRMAAAGLSNAFSSGARRKVRAASHYIYYYYYIIHIFIALIADAFVLVNNLLSSHTQTHGLTHLHRHTHKHKHTRAALHLHLHTLRGITRWVCGGGVFDIRVYACVRSCACARE